MKVSATVRIENNILRVELIKKWVRARRGRMTVLAKATEQNKNDLYATIFENRMSAELMNTVERKKSEIEALERECIKFFPFFLRFTRKGQGRIGKLAEKLETSSNVIRDLSKSKGDSRYRLISHGVERIKKAIREIENERRDHSYNHEKIDVKAYLSDEIQKKSYTLLDVMGLADMIKRQADAGNEDSAVICRRDGDKYRILSIGFDTKFNDMCKSHVCDKSDPHVHATFFASLNVPRKERNKVGQIISFSHSAPCPNCASKLIDLNIDEVYCLFEPELLGGINALGDVGIPVYKYNLVTKSLKTINSVTKRMV